MPFQFPRNLAERPHMVRRVGNLSILARGLVQACPREHIAEDDYTWNRAHVCIDCVEALISAWYSQYLQLCQLSGSSSQSIEAAAREIPSTIRQIQDTNAFREGGAAGYTDPRVNPNELMASARSPRRLTTIQWEELPPPGLSVPQVVERPLNSEEIAHISGRQWIESDASRYITYAEVDQALPQGQSMSSSS